MLEQFIPPRVTERSPINIGRKQEPQFPYFYFMHKGAFTYILRCNDGSFYTGSTKYLELRVAEHQSGEGANYTKNRLPVNLVWYEEFDRIDEAFYREKQIQKWSKKKKEALVNGDLNALSKFAECQNESHFKNASSPSTALRGRTKK